LDFPTFSNISPTFQTSNDSPTSNETSLTGTSQMLNNVDGASPEKTKKRKRRTQAEILQDFKKKLATSQMLNNVDGASPEKTKKRKRRTQAEILQDFKKKLAEAYKNNKTMTKELLEEKKWKN